jgi:hypothetical protein
MGCAYPFLAFYSSFHEDVDGAHGLEDFENATDVGGCFLCIASQRVLPSREEKMDFRGLERLKKQLEGEIPR